MKATKLGTTMLGATVLVTFCAVLTTAWADPSEREEKSGEPATPHSSVVTLAGGEPPPTDAGWSSPPERRRRHASPMAAIREMQLQDRFSHSRRMPIATCLAQGERGPGGPDPCRVGAEISRMRPCLDAEDCPAFDLRIQLYGPPRVENAPRVPVPTPAASEAEPTKADSDPLDD